MGLHEQLELLIVIAADIFRQKAAAATTSCKLGLPQPSPDRGKAAPSRCAANSHRAPDTSIASNPNPHVFVLPWLEPPPTGRPSSPAGGGPEPAFRTLPASGGPSRSVARATGSSHRITNTTSITSAAPSMTTMTMLPNGSSRLQRQLHRDASIWRGSKLDTLSILKTSATCIKSLCGLVTPSELALDPRCLGEVDAGILDQLLPVVDHSPICCE